MAVLKCKMCGGDLQILQDATTTQCEYCGSVQTVPKVDDEKKLALFARANRLRLNCEFDKASGVFESIVSEFPEEAEAYWGLILCKYGIEYVDDPASGKKIPTCHRSSFDSVMEDNDFEMVLEYADAIARRVYREEAKVIEELRKGIIAVSSNEQPYDIFICYKETDANGQRTLDSVLAQDVYQALTEKGYRVFFSRISLEDKLGQEYEPYIFAALHSATIMLAFGTDYEHFNAVWVKNEWSRFMQLIAKGEKKHLIPCYKGIDAYDMPKEFAKLQGQDMGKVGAVQDLLRGIEKLLPKKVEQNIFVQPMAMQEGVGANADSLLKRVFMFLEEGLWENADSYCEKVLDINPEHPYAYLGKLLVELKVTTPEKLSSCALPFSNSVNYQKIMQYADDSLKNTLEECNQTIVQRINETKYNNAFQVLGSGEFSQQYLQAISILEQIDEYKDAKKLIEEWKEKARVLKQEEDQKAEEIKQNNITKLSPIRKQVKPISNFVAAGLNHTVGIMEDGSLMVTGTNDFGQCNIMGWRNIKAVASGDSHTVGLREDGTVVATGLNDFGQCNLSNWKEIIAVCAGLQHTVGLKNNGSVIAIGNNVLGQCNTAQWSDIVAICAGRDFTAGLKKDGTVVSTKPFAELSSWNDIVDVVAGSSHIVGLKADGTVVATQDANDDQRDVFTWNDIIAIAADCCYTVGLKADGTVVAAGRNVFFERDVSGWKNIVSVNAGPYHTIGVTGKGYVVATRNKLNHTRSAVTAFRLFHSMDTWEQERKTAKEQRVAKELEEARRIEQQQREEAERQARMLQQQRVMASRRANGVCQYCGGSFKGVFSKKCVNCGRDKDY